MNTVCSKYNGALYLFRYTSLDQNKKRSLHKIFIVPFTYGHGQGRT